MSVEAPARWDRATYDALRDLLGPDKMDGIVQRFRADLGERFVADDAQARRDAHIVKSTAGMLGFAALTAAATTLEATTDAAAFRSALAAVRHEAAAVVALLSA